MSLLRDLHSKGYTAAQAWEEALQRTDGKNLRVPSKRQVERYWQKWGAATAAGWQQAGFITLLALMLAALAAQIPALRAGRVRIAEAIAYE